VTAHGAWRDIRTLGPVLLIVFGLVLVFAPMTTIGAAGSIGNAGAVASKVDDGAAPGCPTQEQIDTLIEQRLAYEANPDNYIGMPMSLEDIAKLVANCSCDEPHSSGGNAGNAGIVDPILDPCDRQVVDPEPEEPVENEPPAEPEENEPPAEPEENEPVAPPAEQPHQPEAAASPAPAQPAAELPATGNGGPVGTAVVGSLLAALGVLLLVTSRRRTVTP
jgi:hypothetical protein